MAELLHCFEGDFPHIAFEPLSIKRSSHFPKVKHSVRKQEEKQNSASDKALEQQQQQKEEDATTVHEPAKKKKTESATSSPYHDPYDEATIPPATCSFPFLDSSLSTMPEVLLERFSELVRQNSELNPFSRLERFESQFTSLHAFPRDFIVVRKLIEGLLERNPESCYVAVHSLKTIKAALETSINEREIIECCSSGLFSLILRLMHVQLSSCYLQSLGLQCIFLLMGGKTNDPDTHSYPFSPLVTLPYAPLPFFTSKDPLALDERKSTARSVILVIANSLATTDGSCGIRVIVDAIQCISQHYTPKMSSLRHKLVELYMYM